LKEDSRLMAKSFPFYQQLDSMDCGATCLRMVARHFGRYYSLDSLRDLTHIGKLGVDLLSISDAAEEIGLQSLAVKTTFDRLADDIPLPAIAHWDQEHFVVVYEVGHNYVRVADPSSGKHKLSREEFMSSWISDYDDGKEMGILLLMETTPDFYEKSGEEVTKANFGFALSYFAKYRYLIIQIVIGLLLGTILQIIFPFLIKGIVDVGIIKNEVNFVYLVLGSYLLLYFAQAFVDFMRSWILLHVSVRVNVSMISNFLTKLTRLPIRYFDSRLTGDLMQRISDHSKAQHFFTSTSLISIFSFFNIIAFLVVLGMWSWPVFAIFLFGTALNFLCIFLFMRWRRDINYRHFDQSAENQNNLLELIDGMQEIKLHNAEAQKRMAWEHIQAKLFRTSESALRIEQWQRSGSQFIHQTKNIFITFFVALMVIEGHMTLGMLVAIQFIVGQLNSPFNQLIDFVRSYQESKISLERMNEIHLRETENQFGEKITMLPEYGGLSFDNVSFQYNGPHSPMVLKELDLYIPKGKTTAIVGTSGSGKTTILKLLLNFYQPTEGIIRVGDVTLGNLHNRLWRSKCGVVMQDGYIFSDTIAKNIALGDTAVDKTKLLKAVKVANIQSFIESLPLSYNTKIGRNGVGLSQGQKQRILIARAVYKNPDYIFFDEATSALDSYNEMIIMENLDEFFRNRTVVVVAHRLSTVMNADKIVVLDKGEIVEQGTHDELTYMRGAYYQLVRNQLELGA